MPSPLVSTTCPHQPTAFCSSFVSSYTLVSIHPTIGSGQLVEVDGLVRVVVELQVMRRVAGVDEHELLRLRIEERRLPAAVAQREPRGELVRRVVAPARVGVGANLRRHPHAALAVEHRVVRIGRVVRRVGPEMRVAPPQRRAIRPRETRRHLGARRASRESRSRRSSSSSDRARRATRARRRRRRSARSGSPSVDSCRSRTGRA